MNNPIIPTQSWVRTIEVPNLLSVITLFEKIYRSSDYVIFKKSIQDRYFIQEIDCGFAIDNITTIYIRTRLEGYNYVEGVEPYISILLYNDYQEGLIYHIMGENGGCVVTNEVNYAIYHEREIPPRLLYKLFNVLGNLGVYGKQFTNEEPPEEDEFYFGELRSTYGSRILFGR